MNTPVIIAEACQNHNGDREILKKQIYEAANNGADFVKMQSIKAEEVTKRERFEEGVTDSKGKQLSIKRPYQAEYDRLKGLELSLEDERWFVDECIRAGISSMTTAFTTGSVDRLKNVGFESIKIASYDCASYTLLREVKKYWSKIFISTGATYDEEIEIAADLLQDKDATFLHCVTIYPTPLNEFHLKRMLWLRQFSSKVGLSDHSLVSRDGITASKMALALGADCIERHFTVLEADKSKDGPVSITPSQLKELKEFSVLSRTEQMSLMKEQNRSWEEMLGNARRELSDAELLNRDYYRGRFASKIEGKFIYNWENIR